MGFLAQNPDFGPFLLKTGFFRLFSHPRPLPRGGFYINPSRRGPAVPGGGSGEPPPGAPGLKPLRRGRGAPAPDS